MQHTDGEHGIDPGVEAGIDGGCDMQPTVGHADVGQGDNTAGRERLTEIPAMSFVEHVMSPGHPELIVFPGVDLVDAFLESGAIEIHPGTLRNCWLARVALVIVGEFGSLRVRCPPFARSEIRGRTPSDPAKWVVGPGPPLRGSDLDRRVIDRYPGGTNSVHSGLVRYFQRNR